MLDNKLWMAVKPARLIWNPSEYGETIAGLLALAQNGERLMPLSRGTCCSDEARRRLGQASAEVWLPGARAPHAALSGLYLYFSCRDEAHETAQSDSSAEGSYWHAIVHRQEPDASNSAYWFQRVGAHPIFPALLDAAREIAGSCTNGAIHLGACWDPLAFIDICEQAGRRPGSGLERAALEVQRAEWQLLFDYCARRSSR